jgi:3-oxoacyl-(acyl-carrier-protein) synthase
MLNPDLYIRAAATIAPKAKGGEELLRLSADEPDYAGLIPPMQLRRMSKAVRMGIGASLACLRSAKLEKPDAITVGTSLGCIADTEVFLKKLVEQEEQMLSPTAFIQSTHNTVAGQIALATGCHGYNNTLVQHGHSFETAVMGASLYLAEHPDHNMLCGGVDELTDTVHGLLQRVAIYTASPYEPEDVTREHQGAIAGEGAGFLLLSRKSQDAGARISGLAMFSESTSVAAERIQSVISDTGGLRNSDLLLIGAFGDAHSEPAYAGQLKHGIRYRQRRGAWGTDVAPAIAGLINEWPEEKQRAWVVTHWGHDWSVWLLERI